MYVSNPLPVYTSNSRGTYYVLIMALILIVAVSSSVCYVIEGILALLVSITAIDGAMVPW